MKGQITPQILVAGLLIITIGVLINYNFEGLEEITGKQVFISQCTDNDADGFNATGCGLPPFDCDDNDANIRPPKAFPPTISASKTFCPGQYNLTSLIFISGSDITIICNNTIIAGSQASGITVSSASNTTIKGCTFQNKSIGIHFNNLGSYGQQAINNKFLFGNRGILINTNVPGGILISNNTFLTNQIAGIELGAGHGVNNTIFGNNNFTNNTQDIVGTATSAPGDTLIIGTDNNTISFRDKLTINAISIDKNFHVAPGIAALNSSAETTMNTSANITFEVSSCPASIVSFINFTTNKTFAVQNGQLCNSTTTPACTAISCSGTNLTFNAQHFSTFAELVCTDSDGDGFNGTSLCGVQDCDDSNADVRPPTSGENLTSSVTFCPGTFNINNRIRVNASNIVVSCNSTILNGSGAINPLILAISLTNATIQGCTLQNYVIGIELSPSTHMTIRNNKLNAQAITFAIEAIGVNFTSYINNTFVNNTNAIVEGSVSKVGNSYINNTFIDNNVGIDSGGASNYIITGNIFKQTTNEGILISQLVNSTISNNVINDSDIGIVISSASGNVIFSNNVISDSDTGMDITSSGNLSIFNNTISDTDTAMNIASSSGNVSIFDNTVSDSITQGIVLTSGNYRIYGNTFFNSSFDHIFADTVTDTRIFNNVFDITDVGTSINFIDSTGSIFNNTIRGTTFDVGIQCLDCIRSSIANNSIFNTSVGISVDVANNSIYGNTIVDITDVGIDFVGASTGNNVSNNLIKNSDDSGIVFSTSSDGNILTNNTLINNVIDIFSNSGALNTLIISSGTNQLRFEDKELDVNDTSNLFIGASIAAVNSVLEPSMNTSANVSFSVSSCSLSLFSSPGFFTSIAAAEPTSSLLNLNKTCSNNIMNFTTTSFSTVFAKSLPSAPSEEEEEVPIRRSFFSPCISDYLCGEWSLCSEGKQERTCTDQTHCKGKPKLESRNCEVTAPVQELPSVPEQPPVVTKPELPSQLIANIVAALAFAVAVSLFVISRFQKPVTEVSVGKALEAKKPIVIKPVKEIPELKKPTAKEIKPIKEIKQKIMPTVLPSSYEKALKEYQKAYASYLSMAPKERSLYKPILDDLKKNLLNVASKENYKGGIDK